MKKFLAIMLAAVMVFAMAGAVMAEEAAEEPAADFEWNGQKEVWAILPTSAEPGLMVHSDSMGHLMEEEGWTYVVKDAQGNPGNQVQFVEDAIAAGNVGALMIAAMDVPMLEAVCEEAAEKGIAVNMLGARPDYTVAATVATEYALTGYDAVQVALDWLENRLAEGGDIPTNADGQYEVAVDYFTDIQDGIYRSNAVFGAIEEADNLVVVSATQAYGDSAYTDAYDNAQTALAANPDCRIFICYEPTEAMGVNAAIEEYAAQNGLDLADFCVVPCYAEDPTFRSMYEEALEDHSANAIKGYVTYGGEVSDSDTALMTQDEYDAMAAAFAEAYPDDFAFSVTGYTLAEQLLGVTGSENYDWEYGVLYFDDITATDVYGFDIRWKDGEEDPAEVYRTESFNY